MNPPARHTGHTDTDHQESSCLQAAIRYAARGWRVLPVCGIGHDGEPTCDRDDCTRPGKHPLLKDWPHRATDDPETIREWWSQWPQANVGVLTGEPSGVAVLDVDDPKAIDELESASFYTAPKIGPVSTTGRGKHFWFAYPSSESIACATNLRGIKGLDVRGDGGYVVAPPSRHPSGTAYRWAADPQSDIVHDDSFQFGPTPGWMSKPSRESPPDHSPEVSTRADITLDSDRSSEFNPPDDPREVIGEVLKSRHWLPKLDQAIEGTHPGGYENDTSRSGQDQALAYWCAEVFDGDPDKVYAAVRHFAHRPNRVDDHRRVTRKGVRLWRKHNRDRTSSEPNRPLDGAAQHLQFDVEAVTRKENLVRYLDDLGISVSKTFLTRRMHRLADVQATRRRIDGELVRVWVGVRLLGPSLVRARLNDRQEGTPTPQLCMCYNPEHLPAPSRCDGSDCPWVGRRLSVIRRGDWDRPPPD